MRLTHEAIIKNMNPKTKQMFLETIQYEFQKFKNDPESIFHESNLNYNIDPEKLLNQWIQEGNYHKFQSLNPVQKKESIVEYLYESTIIPAFENIHKGVYAKYSKELQEAGDLSGGHLGLYTDIQLENTFTTILENHVYVDIPKEQRKLMIETMLEIRRAAIEELEESSIDAREGNSIVKSIVDGLTSFGSGIIDNIVGLASSVKELLLFFVLFLYSPFMLVGSENVKYKLLGASDKGAIKRTLELIGPCRNLGELLFSAHKNIGEVLKSVNEFSDPAIREFIKEASGNEFIPEAIINSCWDKNATAIDHNEKLGVANALKKAAAYIKTGRMQYLGHPSDSGAGLLGWLFSIDAGDLNFQRSFFEFRKCIYDHIFRVIIGYARIAIEMDIANTQVIETIKDASRRKDYDTFDRLISSTNDKKELTMYKTGRALLSIDEIAERLKENKRILFQDKYLDQFYIYLKQKIKQAFLELDEIAEKKTGEARDKEKVNPEDENYSEDWKNHKLSTIRHGAKPKKVTSIYDM